MTLSPLQTFNSKLDHSVVRSLQTPNLCTLPIDHILYDIYSMTVKMKLIHDTCQFNLRRAGGWCDKNFDRNVVGLGSCKCSSICMNKDMWDKLVSPAFPENEFCCVIIWVIKILVSQDLSGEAILLIHTMSRLYRFEWSVSLLYNENCLPCSDICSTKPCQHMCIKFGYSYRCKCRSCYTKLGNKCELRKCKIGGKCYAYNAVNPTNQCQVKHIYCTLCHRTNCEVIVGGGERLRSSNCFLYVYYFMFIYLCLCLLIIFLPCCHL